MEEGRVAKLELSGANGSLDIFAIYLDDQSPAARKKSFEQIIIDMIAAELSGETG